MQRAEVLLWREKAEQLRDADARKCTDEVATDEGSGLSERCFDRAVAQDGRRSLFDSIVNVGGGGSRRRPAGAAGQRT